MTDPKEAAIQRMRDALRDAFNNGKPFTLSPMSEPLMQAWDRAARIAIEQAVVPVANRAEEVLHNLALEMQKTYNYPRGDCFSGECMADGSEHTPACEAARIFTYTIPWSAVCAKEKP